MFGNVFEQVTTTILSLFRLLCIGFQLGSTLAWQLHPLVVDRYHVMFNGWQERWSEKGNVEPFRSVMEVCLNEPFHFLLKRKGGKRNAFFWHRTLFPMWHLTIWHNFVKVEIVKKTSVLDCVMGLESSDWQGNESSKVRGNCHFLVGSTYSKPLIFQLRTIIRPLKSICSLKHVHFSRFDIDNNTPRNSSTWCLCN